MRALLEEQHPDLAEEPVEFVASGWENDIYRIGDTFTARLPRRPIVALLMEREQAWAPTVGIDLPMSVSLPIRNGRPGCGFPWPWSIGRWFPGETADAAPPSDLEVAADELGAFLAAFHRPPPTDAVVNSYRGDSLADRDVGFRSGLSKLADPRAGCLDHPLMLERWRAALATPPWPNPAVWLHGDVHPLNLIVNDGTLSAVIDFGDLCIGDPASDLAVGWMLFRGPSRRRFRRAAGGRSPVDGATWQRAWGWALALGVEFANGDDRMRDIGLTALAQAPADDELPLFR